MISQMTLHMKMNFTMKLALFVILLSQGILAEEYATDQASLLDLKRDLQVGSLESPALSSWNSSLPFCSWEGVTCGKRHQRVTVLNLAKQNLNGFLSPSVGNLTYLERLNLSLNHIQGGIPDSIGSLSRLQVLDLHSNSLVGNVPASLANCSNLIAILLGFNHLSGTLSDQFGYLQKLLILQLSINKLTGELPGSLGNSSSLAILFLNDNRFHGTIPASLGYLKNLEVLQLSGNKFNGTIPPSLYNLSSMEALAFEGNKLHGNIDPYLGAKFPNLKKGIFSGNQFTGVIPPSVINISGLELFDVGNNYLTGQVPYNLGRLQNLEIFSAGFNNLGGKKGGDLDFIRSFTNVSSLRVLDCMNNSFVDVIPDSIGNLSRGLESLNLALNGLYGKIPEEIGNLINLNSLALSYNNLSGEIPSTIGNLQRLEEVYIRGNILSGQLPYSLGNITTLSLLDLAENQLEGIIPSSLRNCVALSKLYIYNNKFSGALSGEVLGKFPRMIYLILDHNQFSGNFPREVGNLVNMVGMDISSNSFSGEIPSELGSCVMLDYLQMANNLFDGSIPLSLTKLTSAQLLDFSHNNLSGRIPAEFQRLDILKIFDVSFNQLEGEVPSSGVFSNINASFLQGNKKLCGGIPRAGLPRCPKLKPGEAKKLSATKAVIVTGIVACLVALATALVYFLRKKVTKVDPSVASAAKHDGYLRLSYKDLLNATDKFSTSNLIGVGSFGSVYKGVLKNELVIAVKVLDVARQGALKSFKAECNALSKIRHRNLLKVLSSCASLDFGGKDFLALVFEFMPNGSLESWLHESRNLSLKQRVCIAVDIACAMEYLHHQSEPPVVHCDLKPSNVLLDTDMIAHVGDFGLAKLLQLSDMGSVSKDRSSSFAVKGTVGFVPPEYGIGGFATMQGEAYSFGILLLELMTGKRPTDDIFKDGVNLHTLCSSALSNSNIAVIVDSYLLRDLDIDNLTDGDGNGGTCWHMLQCIISMINIGIECTFESPNARMDMGCALRNLHSIKEKFFPAGSSMSSKMTLV